MAVRRSKRYIAAMVMPERDRRGPKLPRLRRRRFRRIPVRVLVPNVVTLLALCAGLTAIRMAFEDRYALALAAIVFAAVLDAVDGRLARLLKGTSRFGAELDSLSDFVNFGVAPALILYFWGLHELKSAGWIAALVFAICVGLRLARFNVMLDDPDRPAWTSNFFVGMPAPAGAITVLLPIYASFLGLPRLSLLIAYPWEILTAGTLAYLATLPFGWLSYRGYERRSAESRPEPQPPAMQSPPLAAGAIHPADDENRPPRLN